jgi:hypothetical protein
LPAEGAQAQARAPTCTKLQRDCLHVLFKIYADRAIDTSNAVVHSLSSVGWRRFARDLLQVGAGHPLLPLQQTCEIYQSVVAHGERPPVKHKTKATWRVGGIRGPVSTERSADFETFVSAVHAVACRWQPANPNPLATMLHAVGCCSFRRPELESKLAARQRAMGDRDAPIVPLRLWDLMLPDENKPTLLDPLCTTSQKASPAATPSATRRANAPPPALPVTPSTAPPSRAAPKAAAAKPRMCRGRTASCASLLLQAPSPPLPSPLASALPLGGLRAAAARGLIRRASIASAEWMDVGGTTTGEGSACSGPAMDSPGGGTASQWVQHLYELFRTRATIERGEGLSWHGFERLALQCRLTDLFSVRQLRGAFEVCACAPPPSAGASRPARGAPPLQLRDGAQLDCCLRRVASLRSSRFEHLLRGLAVSLPPERRGAWQSEPLRLRALQLHIARATSAADSTRLQLCMRDAAQPNGPAVSSGGGWRSRYICLRGSCVLTLPASMRTALITAQVSRRRKLARGGLDTFALLHPSQPPLLLRAPTRDEPPEAAAPAMHAAAAADAMAADPRPGEEAAGEVTGQAAEEEEAAGKKTKSKKKKAKAAPFTAESAKV